MEMIRTKNLAFQFPSGPFLEFPDLELNSEEHLLVLGPSGVGKSTLLHLLAGLLIPSRGELVIGGISYSGLNTTSLDRFRATQLGLIFQKYHFISSLNVEENMRLRLRTSGMIKASQRIKEVAERLSILDLLQKKTHQLSQGQQQRLSIALGLIHQPPLILADEPTANLDDDNCLKVITLLKEEAKRVRSSLVIITHDQRVMNHFQNKVEL